MSNKQISPEEKRMDAVEAALSEAGYEVYEVDGQWFYNGVNFERNADYADGPYDGRKQALHVAITNLGLGVAEYGEPETPSPN